MSINSKSHHAVNGGSRPLYTAQERLRRDSSRWTLVQGVLAPIQFLAFAISLLLVFRFLLSGQGYALANASVIVKTLLLYTIMITGSLWEKAVFGKYLFVPSFFWEDVFSMLVLALHSAYLACWYWDLLAPAALMYLALAAYLSYIINAGQFLFKLRAARREGRPLAAPATTLAASAR